MQALDETDRKLARLQKKLAFEFGIKVDLYRQEGKGVLAVPHGASLNPFNVIFKIDDETFRRW